MMLRDSQVRNKTMETDPYKGGSHHYNTLSRKCLAKVGAITVFDYTYFKTNTVYSKTSESLLYRLHLLASFKFFVWLTLVASTFLLVTSEAVAQQYDVLIKNGNVIDAKNGLNGIMDVAIANKKIARIEKSIPAESARQVIDAKGLYVSPGFIDMHSHNYYGTDPYTDYANGMNALQPDGFTFRSGVTTVVDAGGSGWRNFFHFKQQVIDRAETRVLAFINIVGNGMRGDGPYEQDQNDMDPKLTAQEALRYKDVIVGIKLAHYVGHDWTPLDRAEAAGVQANIPVMVDFGSAKPALELETLFMEKFRPGDIYTHALGGGGEGRQAIVTDDGVLRPFVLKAQQKGVIFDVGHGGASFFYKVAVPAMKQGFRPNTISTDAHLRSSLSGMKDMSSVMSKFLNLGMSIQQVIEASTWKPAQVIHHTELGHLSVGTEADVTLFNIRTGDFGFFDRTGGEKMKGTQKIEVELTLRAGKIVYDLNGRAVPEYSPGK